MVAGLAAAGVLGGCASSGAATYSTQTAAEVATQVEVANSDGVTAITAPRISSRASFGAFSKGMLTGGADFGNALSLHGQVDAAGTIAHWLVAEVQYTNMGGVYRDYDRAGIAGISELQVSTLAMNRDYTPNSVNMTETLRIDIAEADLRARASEGFTLRLADDDDHVLELPVPASYVAGYLQRFDALATASAASATAP